MVYLTLDQKDKKKKKERKEKVSGEDRTISPGCLFSVSDEITLTSPEPFDQ
jgi:hypothetical protein